MIYTKFINQLKAAGIHPVARGSKIQAFALTNAAVDELTGNRTLQNADTVDWRTSQLPPKPGGLFDVTLTGGHGGTKWSKIPLHEPLPSPVMEDPIKHLLRLTGPQFESIMSGKEQLKKYNGDVVGTGPKAIQSALENLDIDKEMAIARAEMAGGRAAARDQAVRRLGYLKSAKSLKIHPREWIWKSAPVLPPMFRQVSVMSTTKQPMVADPNYLYQELSDANKVWKELSTQVADVGEERLNTYKALKAVTGLGDPIRPQTQQQQIRGVLKEVLGVSPKYSTVQRKLLSATTDLVGRGTVVPNPNLTIDEIGLPEESAWSVYEPFVVRRLVRSGWPKMVALQSVREHKPVAKDALLAEMEVRPVVLNRAPVLHKYGVMALRPRLSASNSVEIPPLIVGGFGMDFDGDAAQFHVPSDKHSVAEAYAKMLPSKNLFNVQRFAPMYTPTMEYQYGLWAATQPTNPKQAGHIFRTQQDAVDAYKRGEISLNSPIEVAVPRG